ncbi:Hypothetical protein D9617_30g011110 [Elsinoe fawcettii]|nr:Hypothetical protein D9617_30g011110 [Elsinoe fawcettii]
MIILIRPASQLRPSLFLAQDHDSTAEFNDYDDELQSIASPSIESVKSEDDHLVGQIACMNLDGSHEERFRCDGRDQDASRSAPASLSTAAPGPIRGRQDTARATNDLKTSRTVRSSIPDAGAYIASISDHTASIHGTTLISSNTSTGTSAQAQPVASTPRHQQHIPSSVRHITAGQPPTIVRRSRYPLPDIPRGSVPDTYTITDDEDTAADFTSFQSMSNMGENTNSIFPIVMTLSGILQNIHPTYLVGDVLLFVLSEMGCQDGQTYDTVSAIFQARGLSRLSHDVFRQRKLRALQLLADRENAEVGRIVISRQQVSERFEARRRTSPAIPPLSEAQQLAILATTSRTRPVPASTPSAALPAPAITTAPPPASVTDSGRARGGSDAAIEGAPLERRPNPPTTPSSSSRRLTEEQIAAVAREGWRSPYVRRQRTPSFSEMEAYMSTPLRGDALPEAAAAARERMERAVTPKLEEEVKVRVPSSVLGWHLGEVGLFAVEEGDAVMQENGGAELEGFDVNYIDLFRTSRIRQVKDINAMRSGRQPPPTRPRQLRPSNDSDITTNNRAILVRLEPAGPNQGFWPRLQDETPFEWLPSVDGRNININPYAASYNINSEDAPHLKRSLHAGERVRHLVTSLSVPILSGLQRDTEADLRKIIKAIAIVIAGILLSDYVTTLMTIQVLVRIAGDIVLHGRYRLQLGIVTYVQNAFVYEAHIHDLGMGGNEATTVWLYGQMDRNRHVVSIQPIISAHALSELCLHGGVIEPPAPPGPHPGTSPAIRLGTAPSVLPPSTDKLLTNASSRAAPPTTLGKRARHPDELSQENDRHRPKPRLEPSTNAYQELSQSLTAQEILLNRPNQLSGNNLLKVALEF